MFAAQPKTPFLAADADPQAHLHRPEIFAARAGCTRFTSPRSRRSPWTSRAISKRRSPRWRCRSGRDPHGRHAGLKRQRQRRDPPHILLTTPEQLALILASPDAPYLFGSLRRIVLDELHALVTSKRGDLLSLGLARLFALAPDLTSVGLGDSGRADDLRRFLVPQPEHRAEALADVVVAEGGAARVSMLDSDERLPWAGHSAHHAIGEIYQLIKRHKTTLVFVNTRSQAKASSRSCGASTTTRSRSRCITARSTWRSAARSSGDGGRPAAGGGRHLIARSRRRLGRRRPGDQCGRAERRIAPAAAHRPRQSPHGRAVEGRAGAGQPLRGAGMPRRARRRRRQRAGHAGRPHRRARRAGAARARLRLRRTVPGRRAVRRGEERGALCGAAARRLRGRRRFRRHRRLQRSRPTNASPRSARTRTAAGAWAIR